MVAVDRSLVKWQLPMRRVLYALTPICLASIHFFGWRALAVLAVSNAAALATEYLFLRPYKESVSSAVFVTGTLLGLSLPPGLPLWMVAVGAAFGVAFGKMVFGGFGKNVFNPALVGRAFLYICFPKFMTPAEWVAPARGAVGSLAQWMPDAVTSATPLAAAKAGQAVDHLSLAVGNVSGSLGETSAILVVLGGLYLVWKKAANWRLVVAGLAGTLALQSLFWHLGTKGATDLYTGLCGGSYLFTLFFFITEPVSAPRTNEAKWIYGILFGCLGVLIRTFSVWPAGNMFAVILCNVFGPTIDHAVNAVKTARKKATPSAKEAAPDAARGGA
jgi:Na+-transporting NADH:ubiquinone oxidoreductase subunit B